MARSAQQIIDAAIENNVWWERLCFALVVLFVVTGLTGFIVGLVSNGPLFSLSGTGLVALFWPALRFASGRRRENVRLRMYELALTKAKTVAEACEVLEKALGDRS